MTALGLCNQTIGLIKHKTEADLPPSLRTGTTFEICGNLLDFYDTRDWFLRSLDSVKNFAQIYQ